MPKSRREDLEKAQLAERLRSQFFIDYGVRLPEVLLRDGEGSDDNSIVLLINEIRVEQFTVYFDLMRVVNYSDEVVSFGINPTIHQQGSSQYFWVTHEEGRNSGSLAMCCGTRLMSFTTVWR